MENYHLFFFVSAIAFAVAGSYIIWGPSQRSKKKRKGGVPGLQNIGNSCFLNAVLQALAACPTFIDWLTYVTTKAEIDLKANCEFSLTLLSILKDLNKNDNLCSPNKVIEALRQRRWIISNEEQDAHELFHVLTTTLEEELTSFPPILSLLDVSKLQDESANDMLSDSIKKTFVGLCAGQNTRHTFPTRGLLANQLTCKQCGYKYPMKYDTFDSVSLVIPPHLWNKLRLQDCLQKFISCEFISGVTCEMCSKQSCPSEDLPKPKATFTKQQSFGKLPECLCFHIQRTVWMSNGMSTKCYDHVEFPEVLVMDDYVYNSQRYKKDGVSTYYAKLPGGSSCKSDRIVSIQSSLLNSLQKQTGSCILPSSEKEMQKSNHMYLLKSVIVHLGDLLSGHFVTYRRGSVNMASQDKWYRTSDTAVQEVSFAEVSQSIAYMLFYEKMP